MIWERESLDVLRSIVGHTVVQVTIMGEHVVLKLDDGRHVGFVEGEAFNLGPEWP